MINCFDCEMFEVPAALKHNKRRSKTVMWPEGRPLIGSTLPASTRLNAVVSLVGAIRKHTADNLFICPCFEISWQLKLVKYSMKYSPIYLKLDVSFLIFGIDT